MQPMISFVGCRHASAASGASPPTDELAEAEAEVVVVVVAAAAAATMSMPAVVSAVVAIRAKRQSWMQRRR
jgi:hypothetical protein